MFVNSAEPNDSPLSTLPGCSLTPPVSDKVGSAERQGLPQATRNHLRTGNGTKKSLVKSDSPERENAKAKNLESETARPASTGN
ncbi:hypothetical protein ACIBCC_27060, partial [Streptomyces griseus]|uniref:hypothetical protein n=1 Tax=Streptomyces griseus TaxID=1911 RepID=UPI0037B02B67